MKLDPLFKAQNKKLIRLADDKEFSLDNIKIYKENDLETGIINSDIFAVEVNWSTVEMEEEIYNEEFLALLRDFLKKAENQEKFGFIIPVINKDYSDETKKEAFINAFNHTARRIKDCVSVIGFALTEEVVNAEQSLPFMETLAIKHAQYLYFVKAENITKLENISDFGIVAY